MNEISKEIAHNLTGYVLLGVGVGLIVGGLVGAKYGLGGLTDTGRGLTEAALLALQVKRIATAVQNRTDPNGQ